VDVTPRRVHIVGGPGSGKSTIGASLARNLGVRYCDLDDIALSEGANDLRPLRDLEARQNAVQQVSGEASWVTEGTFLWWTTALFERADLVIWLDPPWRVAAVRILKRHFADYLQQAIKAGTLTTRLHALRYPHIAHLFRFFRWSAHYYGAGAMSTSDDAPDDMRALTREATRAFLEAYRMKTVRFASTSVRELMNASFASAPGRPVEPAVSSRFSARKEQPR
jgi:adenylate kinase family enzyme